MSFSKTSQLLLTRLLLLLTVTAIALSTLTEVDGASILPSNNGSLTTLEIENNTLNNQNNQNNNSLNHQFIGPLNDVSPSNLSSTLDLPLNDQEIILTTKSKCYHQLSANGTCIPPTGKSLATVMEALPFLPIGVVLGLMFFCLCLVLRLFSKARFRNNRSSFFANPQTLKVAQAQERRLSQLSQLSGHSGLRTPRSPRTPSRSPAHSTLRSARSSYGSNVYPINEPASNLHTPTNSVLMKAKSRSNSISSSKLLP